jgi:hypothetical protein
VFKKFLLVPLSDFLEFELEIKCPLHAARVVEGMKFNADVCPLCNDAQGKQAYQCFEVLRANIEWLKGHKWEVSLRMPEAEKSAK